MTSARGGAAADDHGRGAHRQSLAGSDVAAVAPEPADEPLDSAHQAWDRWWGEAKARAHWREPEAAVSALLPELCERGVTTVLDVGAGIGRHALAYAAAGFRVAAVDASPTGIAELDRAAAAAGLTVWGAVARFTALPLRDAAVDHVLAWNVIYHGDLPVVAAALAECRRVLRPGGTLQVTLLSKRNRAFGVGRRIRPDTYVDAASIGDKEHPHCYVDAVGLAGLLAAAGFDPLAMVDVDQRPPGAWHWTVLAEAATARPPTVGG